jgi:hypothetical protein
MRPSLGVAAGLLATLEVRECAIPSRVVPVPSVGGRRPSCAHGDAPGGRASRREHPPGALEETARASNRGRKGSYCTGEGRAPT